MFAPDYRATRLASLQYQVRFHQEHWKKVEADPALPNKLRKLQLPYHYTIIRWLHEQLEPIEGH